MKILIADDEQSIVATLELDLADAGHEVFTAPDGNRALESLRRNEVDCLITDLNMPGQGGMELLSAAIENDASINVIIMTGYGTVESAVEAMKKGATDYILKPFMNEQMISLLEKLERIRELERENTALKVRLQDRDRLEGMIGSSTAMREVFKCVKTVAPTSSSILIQGETGTGKEVIARAIHSHSDRAKHPMVALSCAAVPPTLLEDELFGHDVGAFTDAREKKLGRIERADKGTFFLDDIDDMPLEIQVKLLRVLQEREFERLGGDTTISVDVRIITATKVSLRDMVNEGKFREDLFYRLNVVPLLLPPLRDRQGDVTLLVQHFIEKYGNGRAYEVKEDVRAAMDAYYWPGNIRELEHAVERAIAFAGAGRILKREHLVEVSTQHKKALAVPPHLTTLKEFTEEAERQHIIETLRTTNGHKAQAAGVLGISRKNLWEKMRLYEIEVD